MDQPLELLLTHLDENRALLWGAVDRVPAPLFAQRAAPDDWTVAEVLEHLVLVERRVGGLLDKHVSTMTRRGGAAPRVELVDSILSTTMVRDRSRKITTGEALVPRGGLDVVQVRVALDGSRRVFRGIVERADGLPLETVSFPHTAFGKINLYQWIAFVGSHEARHAAQIGETSARLIRTARHDDESAEREPR